MMPPRLLLAVLLAGSPAVRPHPAIAQQPSGAFSAVVGADSAVFQVIMPASLWARILELPDTAHAGRGSAIWIVWWDTIPRAAIPYTEPFAGTTQEQMVIRVLEVILHQIMVYILCGYFRFHPLQIHGFQFQHHHGAGGVLGKSLVDS